MKFFANLHSHSTHSDGVFSPAELVEVARNEGYAAIALTDHDTVSGYGELKEACDACGMETVFGTEFSSPYPEKRAAFHIVGFNFDPTHPKMQEYLRGLSESESHQTEVLFRRGLAEGLLDGITWEEVLEYNRGITWLCNEHVFRALKHKGLATDRDYPHFFHTVYGARRGEVPPTHDFLTPDRLIPLIHEAGGIAILAHPHNQLQFVEELCAFGIDGIEAWHGDLPTNEERLDALALAGEYDLFVSGGSDHSGLCGGQYARYEHPEETEFYLPPTSVGTTEFFFREIKNQKRSPDRAAVIRDILRNER